MNLGQDMRISSIMIELTSSLSLHSRIQSTSLLGEVGSGLNLQRSLQPPFFFCPFGPDEALMLSIAPWGLVVAVQALLLLVDDGTPILLLYQCDKMNDGAYRKGHIFLGLFYELWSRSLYELQTHSQDT